jgi:hypothetical protein
MPKYRELTLYLQSRTEPVVILSFSEIERIVGPLPRSARQHRAWWSNSTASRHQARYWIDARRQATPDFNAGVVRFTLGGDNPRGPNLSTRTALSRFGSLDLE